MPITVERRGGGNLHFQAIPPLSLLLPSHLPRNVFSGEMRIKGDIQASTWKGLVLRHGLNTGISDVTAVTLQPPCSLLASVWPLVLHSGSHPSSSRMASL